MARKGHTKVIYKGTFICKQTLCRYITLKVVSRVTLFQFFRVKILICFCILILSSYLKLIKKDTCSDEDLPHYGWKKDIIDLGPIVTVQVISNR